MAEVTESGGAAVEAPELAARVRAGDREALAEVVRAYLGQIMRAARGAGLDPHQAEEVTQATFATFLEKAPGFEGRSTVRTYLFGILFRKLQEARRGFARDRRMDNIDQVFEQRFAVDGSWSQPPRPPDLELQDRELQAAIADCLETTPERQRAVFMLREVEGLKSAEIRKILGVTTTNLNVMMFRARNRLRECLESKGVQS